MSKSQRILLSTLNKVSKRTVEYDDLSSHLNLIEELSLDSIACVNLIITLEKKLDISFPEDTDFSLLFEDSCKFVTYLAHLLAEVKNEYQ